MEGCLCSAYLSPEAPPGGFTRLAPCLRGPRPHPCLVSVMETKMCSFPSTQVHTLTHMHTHARAHTHTHTCTHAHTHPPSSCGLSPRTPHSARKSLILLRPRFPLTAGELGCTSGLCRHVARTISRNPSSRIVGSCVMFPAVGAGVVLLTPCLLFSSLCLCPSRRASGIPQGAAASPPHRFRHAYHSHASVHLVFLSMLFGIFRSFQYYKQ